MFLPIDFASVNSERDLAPGTYSAQCTGYGGPENKERAFLFSYTPAGAPSATVYDLVVVDGEGAVRARDFMWLADRSWRDSDGARANDLVALLPAELLVLPQTCERALPDLVVTGSSIPERGVFNAMNLQEAGTDSVIRR